MVDIEISGLDKVFNSNKNVKHVFTDIDLKVSMGEIIAIRGDNGTGKTSLLNIIAGLELPTKGQVCFKCFNNELLRIGYTQQDYTSSLLPWFSTLENISIPLRLTGIKSVLRKNIAEKLLTSLGFNNLPRDLYPHQLSGGQKQRVALSRALIHNPHLLILDEPFANLDAHSCRDIQEILLRIHEEMKPTILFVSHELDHCIYLADRVLLLHGSPARFIYDFTISLPRPRRREIILSSDYMRMRTKILSYEEELYSYA